MSAATVYRARMQRPFWAIGHNTNGIDEVGAALKAGANALEIDVHFDPEPGRGLVVAHSHPTLGEPFVRFVVEALSLDTSRSISLLIFDLKTFDPGLAKPLFRAIDEALAKANRSISCLLSVPSLEVATFFRDVFADLPSNRGLMIDEENDALAVRNLFHAHGVSNAGFGDGTNGPGPNVFSATEQAAALKAAELGLRFNYAWSFIRTSSIRRQLRAEIDGMIADDLGALVDLVNGEMSARLRMATEQDDPFAPWADAHGLVVVTSSPTDRDATMTISIEDDDGGRAMAILDASLGDRFAEDAATYVTLFGACAKPRRVCLASSAPVTVTKVYYLGPNGSLVAKIGEAVTAPGIVRDLIDVPPGEGFLPEGTRTDPLL
ncbi:hypothetical protein BH09MYX1_BH09MYX1_05780 [soil metagenome]